MRGPVFEDARTSDGFSKVKVDTETELLSVPAAPTLPRKRYERLLWRVA